MAFLDKFAESSIFFAGSLESRDSLLECMFDGFGDVDLCLYHDYEDFVSEDSDR